MISRNSIVLWRIAGLAVAFAAAGAVPAQAADSDAAKKEIDAAAQHAQFSVRATDISGAQLHLHHTINCLVGARGAGFDDSAGNPCDGYGAGAILDVKEAAKKATLTKALEKANEGLKATDLAVVHDDAVAVEGLLKDAL